MEKKRTPKKVKRIFVIILVIVVGYMLVWFANYYRYVKWEKNLGYSDRWQSYVLIEDEYTYSVGKPVFPSFTGNFSIAESLKNDTQVGDVMFDIIIWPKLGGKCEIGVMLEVVEENENDEIIITSYQVMIDENLELIIDETREATEKEKAAFEAYENNFKELKTLLDRADELWNIYK